MHFKVSVIIPAYKAERFIEKAVRSAVKPDEVGEVLVIIDGVFDSTEEIVEKLMLENSKIKIFKHPNNMNLGAAASRNLGIKNASLDYISFLDADDFYLENRFYVTKKVFEEFENAEGVYEAIGTFAYDQKSYELHIKRIEACQIKGLDPNLTTIVEKVDPSFLFETLVYGKKGWFHFNGLTLKKDIINKVGYINEYLNRYGEDNEFFIRLAIRAQLYPGSIDKPVALRGVYMDNITLNTFDNDDILRKTFEGDVFLVKLIFNEILSKNYNKELNRFVLMRYLDSYSVSFKYRRIGLKRKVIKFCLLIKVIFNNPKLIQKLL